MEPIPSPPSIDPMLIEQVGAAWKAADAAWAAVWAAWAGAAANFLVVVVAIATTTVQVKIASNDRQRIRRELLHSGVDSAVQGFDAIVSTEQLFHTVDGPTEWTLIEHVENLNSARDVIDVFLRREIDVPLLTCLVGMKNLIARALLTLENTERRSGMPHVDAAPLNATFAGYRDEAAAIVGRLPNR